MHMPVSCFAEQDFAGEALLAFVAM